MLKIVCFGGGLFELQLFEKVEVDKPIASRTESAEIYLVGLKYKAPAKIDPRLLDYKHLFQASAQPQAKVNCFFDDFGLVLYTYIFVALFV